MSTLFDDLPMPGAGALPRPAAATEPARPDSPDQGGADQEHPDHERPDQERPAHDASRLPKPTDADTADNPSQDGRRRWLRVDPDKLLEGLNPQQRAAVVHEGTPLLIVAGAGSGKTRVLTHRIAYLLAARDVHPGQILAITFTNKAAGEMKERVARLIGPRAKAMWVSTFHSACVRILRKEAKQLGLTSGFSIYDQADSQRLMTLVVRH